MVTLKSFRLRKGLSQEMLADKSGVSIRTIQRIEKGLTIGSAYTMHAIANALEIEITDLTQELATPPNEVLTDNNRLKLLNLSALCVLLIPLSNLFIPAIIFWKNKADVLVNTIGRRILSFQLLWTVGTVVMMAVIPMIVLLFSESLRGARMPLFVPVYLCSVVVNVCFIIRFAWSFNERPDITKNLINIL